MRGSNKKVRQLTKIMAVLAIVVATVIWSLSSYASDEAKENLMLWTAVLTALLTLALMWFILSRGDEVIKSLEKRKEEADSVESSDDQGEVP